MAGLNKAYKRRPSMVSMNGGPVLCLDAGSKLSYPGTGTTWTDLSGNGNNGTLTNGPTFDSTNGGSLVFNGSNQYAELTNAANDLVDFTVCCMFKTTQTSVGLLVSKLVNYGSGAGWGLFLSNGSVRLILQQNGSQWGVYYTAGGYANGLWHYAAAVISGRTLSAMYVDGVAKSTTLTAGTAWTSYSNAVPIRIGTDALPEFFFTGNIAVPQVYNRALSATEISTNFELLRGRYGI